MVHRNSGEPETALGTKLINKTIGALSAAVQKMRKPVPIFGPKPIAVQ